MIRSPSPQRSARCAARSLGLLVCLGPWLLAASATAVPAADEPHEVAPMPVETSLTLHALFEGARSRHPRLGLVDAQADLARAHTAYADSWLPDAAQAYGYHISDRPFDDRGLYEDEVSISMPLWMPGEKKARGRLAEASTEAAQAGAAEFDWRVSGEVRRALWGLLQARRRWELAMEQQANLEQVLEQARLFEESGEISRGDALAVVQELGAWRAETLALEAAWQDAARSYRALTGAAALPAAHEERLSERDAIDENHPALRLARERLAAASAQHESLRQGNDYRPAVQVFWRKNRPDDASPADSALGIGFEVPLGRSPSMKPEVAAANEAMAEAQAQLLQRQRDLELMRHEAEHELHTLERQLENAAELLQAAEDRRALDALELELGEIGVQEWLRRLARYGAIRRDHDMLLLRHGEAVAAFNQAVGETL